MINRPTAIKPRRGEKVGFIGPHSTQGFEILDDSLQLAYLLQCLEEMQLIQVGQEGQCIPSGENNAGGWRQRQGTRFRVIATPSYGSPRIVDVSP